MRFAAERGLLNLLLSSRRRPWRGTLLTNVVHNTIMKQAEREHERGHDVISVSLPRDLARRLNDVIPRSRRSRVIAGLVTAFLESVARRRVEEQYAAYYARRPAREVREEQAMLAQWELADADAWAILEREEAGARRPTR